MKEMRILGVLGRKHMSRRGCGLFIGVVEGSTACGVSIARMGGLGG